LLSARCQLPAATCELLPRSPGPGLQHDESETDALLQSRVERWTAKRSWGVRSNGGEAGMTGVPGSGGGCRRGWRGGTWGGGRRAIPMRTSGPESWERCAYGCAHGRKRV